MYANSIFMYIPKTLRQTLTQPGLDRLSKARRNRWGLAGSASGETGPDADGCRRHEVAGKDHEVGSSGIRKSFATRRNQRFRGRR